MGKRSYTDEQLRAAVAKGRTMREVLIALSLAPYGGNYETVRRRIADLKLDAPHLARRQRGRPLRGCSDADVIEAVSLSRSLAEVLARLGSRPGGNQARLKARIAELELDTSHFVGQGWRRGLRSAPVPRRPLSEILVEGRSVQTGWIRKRLIEEGVKQSRCEVCHLDSWNGLPIPLELDHVNGRRNDNRLSNLRVVCPNCHAQTETYRGRNIGRSST